MKKKGKLGRVLGLFAVCTLLSGCNIDWNTLNTNTDNAASAIQDIEDRNVNFIKSLESQGFLTQEQSENWQSNVKSKVQAMQNVFKNGDGTYTVIKEGENGESVEETGKYEVADVTEELEKAITKETIQGLNAFSSYYVPYDKAAGASSTFEITSGHPHEKVQASPGTFYHKVTCDEKEDDGSTCGEEYDEPISCGKFNTIKGALKGNSKCVGEAFRLYDPSQVTALQDALARPVYIINNFDGANKSPEKLQIVLAILNEKYTEAKQMIEDYSLTDFKVENIDISKIASSKSINDSDMTVLEKYLISYCTAVKEGNKNISYLDVGGYASNGARKDSDGKPYIFADTVFDAEHRQIGTNSTFDGSKNALGEDLSILADGKVAINIRIMEFNPDLLESLGAQLNDDGSISCKGKFYLTKKSKENIAIKLEYPLYKIDGIKTDNITDKDWRCTISDTGLYMDLLDGSLYDDNHIKMNYKDNFYNNSSVTFWDSYKVDSKDSSSDEVTDTVSGKTFKVRPLVLKDYVELYYIKNENKGLVADNEYWTAVGRRMRIRKFKYDSSDDKSIVHFAQSLNFDGSVPDNVNWISAEDIVDKTSGYGFYTGVREQLGLGKENPTDMKETIEAERESGDTLLEKMNSGNSSTDSLRFKAEARFTSINPTICLGTEEKKNDTGLETPALGAKDHSRVYTKDSTGTYGLPTIYGMCLGISLRDSNMIGGNWINNSESACTELIKWNTWLSSNGFQYNIDIPKLLSLLGIKTIAQNDGESAVTFDPDVLQMVQNQRENSSYTRLVSLGKTILKLAGFVLQAYGLLLLAAWIFDTNIYSDFRLFTLLTFGVCEAVKDPEEIGIMNDRRAISLISLMAMMVKIEALGVTLVIIDIMKIIDFMENMLIPLMETLKGMLIG